MSIKAIVFDKDGTLVDFDKLWIPAVTANAKSVLSRFGAGEDKLYEYIKSVGVEDGFVDIKGALPKGDYQVITENMQACLRTDGIEVDYDTLYPYCVAVYSAGAKRAEDIYPICDNLRESLYELKSMGYRLAVITGDAKDGAVMCLDRLGITDMFDEILAYDGIHPPKPDRYYMDYFCEKFGYSPSEVLMVGDTETDMRFAVNSGAYPLGVGKTDANRAHLLAVGAEDAVYDVSHIKSWLSSKKEV